MTEITCSHCGQWPDRHDAECPAHHSGEHWWSSSDEPDALPCSSCERPTWEWFLNSDDECPECV